MTILLAAIPSILALIILIGMILKAGKIITAQLDATKANTSAIDGLTERLVMVEAINVKTNVIATDIQHKVTNGES